MKLVVSYVDNGQATTKQVDDVKPDDVTIKVDKEGGIVQVDVKNKLYMLLKLHLFHSAVVE